MEIGEEIDIKNLILKYRSLWYVFFISILLTLCAAFIFNKVYMPVYQAKSTILISQIDKPSPLMPEPSSNMRSEGWRNEIAILQSQTLVENTLNNMAVDITYYNIERFLGIPIRREIYKNAPFKVNYDRNHPQPYGQRLRIKVLSDYTFSIRGLNGCLLTDSGKFSHFNDEVKGPGYSFLVNIIQNHNEEITLGREYEFVIHNSRDITPMYISLLNAEPRGRDYSIVDITFRANNQQRALEFVQNLSDMYIQQNLDKKNQTAQNTKLFIENQLAGVSDELNNTELNLQQFRQRHQMLEIGPVANQLSEELKELDNQKSIELVKRQYYDLLMEYVQDDLEFSQVFGPSALGIDDPLLNSLLMDLSKFHNERARMLLTTTINSPSIQAIEENIKHTKANLKENIQSMKAANEIIMNDLNQRIRGIEERINQIPQTEREMIRIQRMNKLNEATYNFLKEKYSEASITLASNIPDHRVIDPAHLFPAEDYGHVQPKIIMNYAIALILGMVIPIFFLALQSYFNTRIMQLEDVSKTVNFPIVGLIPHFKKTNMLQGRGPDLLVETEPSIIESFRSLRSNLLLLSPSNSSRMIVVTSTREQEGKTFTALKLAESFHLLNQKTVYINADLRKPSYLPNASISDKISLSNYLIGKIDLDKLLMHSQQNKNLNIIPGGLRQPNAAELFESDAMYILLEKLKSFRNIIIDTPPIGLVSDATPLLTQADIILYIFRHGYSQHADLDFLTALNRNARLNRVGIVINDINKTGLYGYGYGYGYGVGYPTENKGV